MPTLSLGLGLQQSLAPENQRIEKRQSNQRHCGRRRRRQSGNGDTVADHQLKSNPVDVGSDSQLSPLASRERCGPDQDPAQTPTIDAFTTQSRRNSSKEDEEVLVESIEENEEHSFTQGLRECQNLKCRSEAVAIASSKPQRCRTASLDFNGQGVDASLLSPRFFGVGSGGLVRMKKGSATSSSRSRSGAFPSPGTPNYRHGAGASGYQKGWSSERVPLPAYCNRRYGGGGALAPFSNGRALPSKWEDAERWIFSPVSSDGIGMQSMPSAHLRRPKSKSGPLGPSAAVGGSYSTSASPLVPCFDSGRVGNFAASSPFLAGVLMPEIGCCVSGNSGRGSANSGGSGSGLGGRKGGSFLANGDTCIIRSASIHGWSDTLIESSSSLPSSQDEKFEGSREESTMVSPSAMRKDAGTQMSPEGSATSSPKERPLVASTSSHPIEELESQFAKLEVRDVQVDDRVTVTRWSKKHIARSSDRRSTNIIELKKTTVEADNCPWDAAETTKSISKYKREEAKITAWENLQKAKAEAEIIKLEMKLEKKRSSSMDKILNKLRLSQKKAQDMRTTLNARKNNQAPKSTKISFFSKASQISSLSGCFICHGF